MLHRITIPAPTRQRAAQRKPRSHTRSFFRRGLASGGSVSARRNAASSRARGNTIAGRRDLAVRGGRPPASRRDGSLVLQRAPTPTCPSTSCPGIPNTTCSLYAANAWWLPDAYVNNATCACRETPNHPTAKCVRKVLQDRLTATPVSVKRRAAREKVAFFRRARIIGPGPALVPYNAYVVANLTPRIYRDHVVAYRTAGCPSGPAAYPAWIGVTTVPIPSCPLVGASIRYGGGSCSGRIGHWC